MKKFVLSSKEKTTQHWCS